VLKGYDYMEIAGVLLIVLMVFVVILVFLIIFFNYLNSRHSSYLSKEETRNRKKGNSLKQQNVV